MKRTTELLALCCQLVVAAGGGDLAETFVGASGMSLE